MKLTKLTNLMVLGAALTMTAVGCKPYKPTVIGGDRNRPVDPSSPHGLDNGTPITPINTTGTDGIASVDPTNFANYTQDRTALAQSTVYFEFDKSSIKSSEQSKLEAVATYLKSNPTHALQVEGNCDERGTEEYNRSLGERRALASREYLVRLGIDPGKIVTKTNGEDSPAEHGHDESAWSKNRRDEFVVLTPPR